MKKIILFICLISQSYLINAETCFDPTGDPAMFMGHAVEYKSKIREPGFRFTLDGSEFVIVRMPFVDFRTNSRWAITYPVQLRGTGWIHFFQTVEDLRPDCSDVRIVGRGVNPVHRVEVTDIRRYTSFVLNSPGIFESERNAQVLLRATISNTRIYLAYSYAEQLVDNCNGSPQGVDRDCNIAGDDFDLTDNINWDAHTEWPTKIFSSLGSLIDYIYIQKLN